MSKPQQGNRPKYKKGQPNQRPATTAASGVVPAREQPAPRTPDRPGRVLTLDPLAPLICRSGRPFDDQAGPDGARFPPPSTVAGCVRTAWARENGAPLGPDLMQMAVAGPLLARPDGDNGFRLFAPKPADALYFGSGAGARCVRAVPAAFEPGCGADLPEGLLPVQLPAPEEGKPGSGPDWWAWDDLLRFREGERKPPDHAQLTEGGWSPPPGDQRTHVRIERTTQAAASGQLFQTMGLDFAPPEGLAADPLSGLRLLVRCAEPLSPTLTHLGGERRLAELRPVADAAWPQPTAGWLERIGQLGGLSLTLLTPALFSGGYRPGWLSGDLTGCPPSSPGVQLRLRAAALGRWQPHSGWNLAAQRPRAGRKLIPAGATWWFELIGQPSVDDLEQLWLTSLYDCLQDRLDGFGLALPAAWTPPVAPSVTHASA
ncbi:type III-B CRISPR module-associated Cmr3 family protein [uncultured Lamprocystis sp.]|uniref:type III-B CRISPR module-associated Cmr3 family protein n=1 Tax=uncultured Lamprocystis sp. TaxID=543132 RepID=UPI0025F94ECC|nr:type III-B CRISPR module-associated Cmr3 family protein [uncultured Lamprocystis sp.]